MLVITVDRPTMVVVPTPINKLAVKFNAIIAYPDEQIVDHISKTIIISDNSNLGVADAHELAIAAIDAYELGGVV